MPFCSNCGTKLTTTARFCSNCGCQINNLSHKGNERGVSSGYYRNIGIISIIVLILIGIATFIDNNNTQNSLVSNLLSYEKTKEDIMEIKTQREMLEAISNTTWCHTDKGDIWYKFVFKKNTMTHYAAFPSDGHWRYLGEVDYSIVETRSSYDGKRYLAAIFDIAKYNVPVEFNLSNCHLYSFGVDLGSCQMGDYEWD
jgi:hypothetical protein